jgi:hypothetical protein
MPNENSGLAWVLSVGSELKEFPGKNAVSNSKEKKAARILMFWYLIF